MSDIKYITPEDLIVIVDIIQNFEYVHDEEVPRYDEEEGGIDDYLTLIERIKDDSFYPDICKSYSPLPICEQRTLFF
ncbi:MAG: hypothetical protein LR017_01415 [Candidatus Pacebacteria bacterium]|jgi:hypothetical protein|nr:hypothetical protein [Candidatus Paceibacterota bacterium]